MKYKELIQFDPITTVVKLADSSDKDKAANLVKTFVFSAKLKEDVEEIIIKNLIPNPPYETKGIQIVGSYGTGKSHLMSLVSSIAENSALLEHLATDKLRSLFGKIAGKYQVLRFEIGTDRPLKDIVFTQLERFLNILGVDYSFDESSNLSWKELLQRMMAEFESKYSDKYLLLVIDEMLEYLKGRKPNELNNDLMLLRQLGELCDDSRFRIMFGVQELLYRSPEFQFQAEMLNKIEDRYSDLTITREDVSYVVKERLLKKDERQKEKVRKHLLKFAHLFEGINTNLNEYVDLFPVHPEYIGHFERIKHGKSQREILKVLSSTFEDISENSIPADSPGLITYDTYWKELSSNPSMLTFPDIRTVKEKTEIIEERINTHFKGARQNRKQLARQIANGLAINLLCDDLDKRNGANGTALKENLCLTIAGVDDAELLLAAFESAAKQLIQATSGQYVDFDNLSGNFYIRTEGGINVPQIVIEYADTVLKKDPERADQYYFDFLQYVMGMQQTTYRTGFKIWEHSLNWVDKKSFRLGYIFFGNPNERSTTEPIQQYYIFFCPVFSSIDRNDEADEVYFDMSSMGPDFREEICLYGAAKAKEASATSSHKPLFRAQIEEHLKRAITFFDREFVDKTKVIYKAAEKPLKSFQLPGEGAGKDMLFSDVAAKVLNGYFNDKFKNYPAFTDLTYPVSKDNFEKAVKNALKKITAVNQPNREGEAILSGLGLWSGQNIDLQNSKYADSIKTKLREKGEGTVINRNELIYPHHLPKNLWYSLDFNIDHQLEFIVLAAMAYKGDIQITWSQSKTLSATNIETLTTLEPDDFHSFQHIKEPQGLPVKALKQLFASLNLPDLTTELEKPETVAQIITRSKTLVEEVVTVKQHLSQGLKCRNIALVPEAESAKMKEELDTLHTLLDSVQSYNTYGKIKSFRHTEEDLKSAFNAYPHCALVEKLRSRGAKFEQLASYLYTAQSYIIEEEKLFSEITAALNKLPVEVKSEKEPELKKYEALLNSLADRYADYYIGMYFKYRLSAKDYGKKETLLNSSQKRICDIIKEAEMITAAEYHQWIAGITSLKQADTSLTKQKVKEEPYHEFNPREYYGKPLLKMDELEEQLDNILAKWRNAMRSVFKDPSVQQNMGLLSKSDKKLVEDFIGGAVDVTLDNAAKLRDLINQFARGIEKIEITIEDIRQELNKPLSPGEAINAITAYIEKLCAGKERSKIRIIIK